MDKIVFVKAKFRPIGRNVTVKVPTGETKRGLLGGTKQVTRKEQQWQQTGWSDCEIDSERLAEDLQEAVSQLNSDGFEVMSVTPVASGGYNFSFKADAISSSPRLTRQTEAVHGGASYGYGYGFSYTESLLVHAKRHR